MGIVLACSCSGFDDDLLVCEEAVSRLEECCPGLDPLRFPCSTTSNACSNFATRSLTEGASECILEKSCDDLVNQGTCARLIRRSQETPPTSIQTEIEGEVCK